MAGCCHHGVCQGLLQEMKTIPAKYLPTAVKTELSKILDPKKDLPDNDYRYFAERNGLRPNTWQWLDSQKTEFCTSSILKVLAYLESQRGDNFTVYDVYKTLVDMRSAGQSVIISAMPGIRQMFHGGTRPGQEHSEPPSVTYNLPPPPTSNPPSNPTVGPGSGHPSPQYNVGPMPGGPQSNVIYEREDGDAPLNNLSTAAPRRDLHQHHENYYRGDPPSVPPSPGKPGRGDSKVSNTPSQPGRNSSSNGDQLFSAENCALQIPGQSPGANQLYPRPSVASVAPSHTPPYNNLSHPRSTAPCEVSYYSSPGHSSASLLNSPPPPPPADSAGGRGQAREDSYLLSDDENSSLDRSLFLPPSYDESQQQYYNRQGIFRHPSLTQMQDLKLPLSGLVVTAEGYEDDFPGSVSSNSPSVPPPATPPGPLVDPPVPGSLDPRSAGHSGAPSAVSDVSSDASGSLRCNIPYLSVMGRPFSYPKSQSSTSYKSPPASRPLSDAVYNSLSSDNSEGARGFSPYPFVIASDLSASLDSPLCRVTRGEPLSEGCPWQEDRHQTQVKELLPGDMERSLTQECHSLPTLPSDRNSRGHRPELTRQTSVPNHLQGIPGSTSRFVFIMAADMDDRGEKLDREVGEFCRMLEERGVGYVLITSTHSWPKIRLPTKTLDRLPRFREDFEAIQHFLWDAFKKASKVLMLISPGYLPYADEYTAGAGRSTIFQQRLLRKAQEKLKEEFFKGKRTFRIWPVLLSRLRANRLHVPGFLSQAAFYWFPCQEPGAEDLVQILWDDLNRPRPSDVKRGL